MLVEIKVFIQPRKLTGTSLWNYFTHFSLFNLQSSDFPTVILSGIPIGNSVGTRLI